MKSFRLLAQHIERWRRVNLSETSRKRLSHSFQNVVGQAKRYTDASPYKASWRKLLRLTPKQVVHLVLRPQPGRRKARFKNATSPKVLAAIAIISLTSVIGYRFYNEPQLAVETVAPQTLRAPESAAVEDTKTTEESRRAARTGAIPVLMIDPSVNQEIYQSLQRLIEEGNTLRQQAGAFPYVETSLLSVGVQRYLRQTDDDEWKSVLAAVEGNISAIRPRLPNTASEIPVESDLNSSKQLAVLELQNYRRTHSAEDFAALKQVITRARQRYTSTVTSLSAALLTEPGNFYDLSLLTLTDTEWLQTRTGVRQAIERILVQGIPPGLPDSILENAVQAQVSLDVPDEAIALASRIILTVTQPNLVEDPEQTRLRAEQAAQAVEPVIVNIRRGEVIVRTGETITQADFVLLDHFGLSRRGINWFGVLGFGAWVTVALGIFLVVEHRFHPGLRRRDYVLVLLLTLTTPVLIAVGFASTSLPLVGLLIGSFYGSPLGVTVVALLGITLPLGMEIGLGQLIASWSSSLVGAIAAGRLRSREELALLGCTVGLIQGVVYLIISLILSAPGPVWYSILTASGLQGLIGIAWSIVALGISPYLEHLFDLVTPIRLAELSNPNRPLLKRLASEAPGTFQHTLFVASLAEAAARALRCNVELVRAGTLYHDIGKMHDALGFIENQMGGPNKHDAINDPWVSADIIKRHVSEGLVMARKCRLPKAIQAFIPEHQGTMLIAYFYHEAQQRAAADPNLVIHEADFRYDGPIPQSRETGIVMLADSCEAALRSLKDSTPEDALAMVNRILRARWQDNQLIDSGLTRTEMGQIAEIFVRVWQQYNHQRIAYPKLSMPQPQPSSVGS